MKSMKYSIFIALILFLSNYSYSADTEDISQEYLPGEFEVKYASSRPTARVYYLIYAASLEGNTSTKEDFNKIFGTYKEYEKLFPEFSKIVDPQKEMRSLNEFLSYGYEGQLKEEFHSLLKTYKEHNNKMKTQ